MGGRGRRDQARWGLTGLAGPLEGRTLRGGALVGLVASTGSQLGKGETSMGRRVIALTACGCNLQNGVGLWS